MIFNTVTKLRYKPEIGDTRTVKRFLLIPTPNAFMDKKAWLEYCSVIQIYDEQDGMPRWRNMYFIESKIGE